LGRSNFMAKQKVLPSIQCFPAKEQARSDSCLPKMQQKLAVWTSLPLTEVKPVQTANLCFKCKHLQRLTQHIIQLAQLVLPEFGLPLAP